MFMYSYCYVCSVLCILFHCAVLCTVCVQMCTVLLPPGGNPIAVRKIYHISYSHVKLIFIQNAVISRFVTKQSSCVLEIMSYGKKTDGIINEDTRVYGR